MQYVAEVSGKGQDIDRVKEQLLQSNPVLEGTDIFTLRDLTTIVLIRNNTKLEVFMNCYIMKKELMI